MMFNFKQFGSQDALITETETVSYSDLAGRCVLIASHMRDRSLIFCLCQNSLGSVIGYAACMEHNHVPLLLPADIDRVLLARLLDIYKPQYLWLPVNLADGFAMARIAEDADYILLATSYAPSYPMHKDLALLLTTSGSTGSPKLVRHTRDNISSNMDAIISYLNIDNTERPITTLPLHYTYGLSVLNIHMSIGATVILTGSALTQKAFWKLFNTHGATSIAGVPTTYEILDRLSFYKMNLPTLRYLNQAGGKMRPELQKKFINWAYETGRKFFVMYGQTEASPRMGYLPWEYAREKYGCMGISIPGGQFQLIDESGSIIQAHGERGELIYKGPNVTPGYAERGEDLLRGDDRHGILHTGDIAICDSDGFYTVVGRKSRFLKIYGNRVNLDEVEMLLRNAFPGIDCACTGTDNQLYVFTAQDMPHDDILNFLTSSTRLNHLAFHIINLSSLPKSGSGKILYKELEKYYA